MLQLYGSIEKVHNVVLMVEFWFCFFCFFVCFFGLLTFFYKKSKSVSTVPNAILEAMGVELRFPNTSTTVCTLVPLSVPQLEESITD